MFPSYEPLIENSLEEKTTLGKSFLFDFNRGDFVVKDGKLQVVEGMEALKLWVEKILKTEKFKFKIYETGEENEYGTTLLELINSVYPRTFIESEVEREVTEALVRSNEILEVSNFNFRKEKRTLTVSFSMYTIYGDTVQEVSV